jgi:hypothetical protein
MVNEETPRPDLWSELRALALQCQIHNQVLHRPSGPSSWSGFPTAGLDPRSLLGRAHPHFPGPVCPLKAPSLHKAMPHGPAMVISTVVSCDTHHQVHTWRPLSIKLGRRWHPQSPSSCSLAVPTLLCYPSPLRTGSWGWFLKRSDQKSRNVGTLGNWVLQLHTLHLYLLCSPPATLWFCKIKTMFLKKK